MNFLAHVAEKETGRLDKLWETSGRMMGRRDKREQGSSASPSLSLRSLSLPTHLFFISFLASIWLDLADRQTDGLHTTGELAKNSLEFTASELRRDVFPGMNVHQLHGGSARSHLVTCPLLRPTVLPRGWVHSRWSRERHMVEAGPTRRVRGRAERRADLKQCREQRCLFLPVLEAYQRFESGFEP